MEQLRIMRNRETMHRSSYQVRKNYLFQSGQNNTIQKTNDTFNSSSHLARNIDLTLENELAMKKQSTQGDNRQTAERMNDNFKDEPMINIINET